LTTRLCQLLDTQDSSDQSTSESPLCIDVKNTPYDLFIRSKLTVFPKSDAPTHIDNLVNSRQIFNFLLANSTENWR